MTLFFLNSTGATPLHFRGLTRSFLASRPAGTPHSATMIVPGSC
ncbi:hypothetical protein ACFSC4_28360 [Deinococcus malanensis]|nr:hypothetical protein [Deinococcus malanensis]